jgi:hypothetical protein
MKESQEPHQKASSLKAVLKLKLELLMNDMGAILGWRSDANESQLLVVSCLVNRDH